MFPGELAQTGRGVVSGRRPMGRIRVLLCVFFLLGTVVACGDPESPEEQVRRTLKSMEEAAAAKDLKTLKAFISENYQDPHGRDKKALHGLIGVHFLRSQQVHVYLQVRSIEFEEPEDGEPILADVVAFAAIGDGPMGNLEQLRRLRADVYRFHLELTQESDKEWRLTWAKWKPATLDDLKGG